LDAALTGSSGATAGGTEGATNSSVLSNATFTDAKSGDNSAEMSATIHWGDSTSSAGTVSYDSGTNTYTVNGSHTYAEEGTFAISIAVADAGGSTTPITGSASIAEVSMTMGKLPDVTGMFPGDTVTLTRYFTDPVLADGPWTVSITDGAGNTLTPTVTATS